MHKKRICLIINHINNVLCEKKKKLAQTDMVNLTSPTASPFGLEGFVARFFWEEEPSHTNK